MLEVSKDSPRYYPCELKSFRPSHRFQPDTPSEFHNPPIDHQRLTLVQKIILNAISRGLCPELQELLSTSPVVSHTTEILSFLARNNCFRLSAPTGTGKSTILPLILHEAGYRCAVLEPRRNLVQRGASQVARFYNQIPGPSSVVGWAHGLDAKLLGQNNDIRFFTVGYHLYRLWGQPTKQLGGKFPSPISTDTVVVIDEWHERSELQTILFEELKGMQEKMRQSGLQPFKIILCSATIPEDDILNISTPLLLIEGSAKGRPRVEIKTPTSGNYIDLTMESLRRERSVLIHCSSKRQAEEIAQDFRSRRLFPLYGDPDCFEVVALHAHAPRSAAELAYRTPARGMPIVIVSTLSRTGENIPHIQTVIDLGITRRKTFCDEHLANIYTRDNVTGDGFRQGLGRVGRVPLSTRADKSPDEYIWLGELPLHQLAPSTSPAVKTADLSPIFLRFLAEGRSIIEFAAILKKQGAINRLEPLIARMYKVGFISHSHNLTLMGRLAASLPLDPLLGKLVGTAMWQQSRALPEQKAALLGLVDLAIATAALIESEGIISTTLGDKKPWLKFSQNRSTGQHEQRSDIFAQLYAYLRFRGKDANGNRPNGEHPTEMDLLQDGLVEAALQRTYEKERSIRERLHLAANDSERLHPDLKTILSSIKLKDNLSSVSIAALAAHKTRLLTCIAAAFVPYIYMRNPGARIWRGSTGSSWITPKSSVVTHNPTVDLAVAIPRIIENEDGGHSYYLDWCTAVNPKTIWQVTHGGCRSVVAPLLESYSQEERGRRYINVPRDHF